MTLILDRRRLLGLATGAGVAAALPLPALASEKVVGDIVLGDADAPLTVIEYASFTCPHCMRFHTDTWPRVKADYVETGKIRFILREVYFDPYGLWASMIARCGGREAFYPLADALMEQQDTWTRAEDRAAAIQKIGRANGLSSADMRECLQDRGFAEELVERYKQTAAEDGIQSTPSFVIAGEVTTGNMGYEEFSALLDAALADVS